MIADVYKWSVSEIEKLYLEDDNIYGLFFWEERARKYLEKIQKSGINSL